MIEEECDAYLEYEESADLNPCHVYLLADPRYMDKDERAAVFYVGKGTGARAEAHEHETGESAKVERIAAIRDAGFEPSIVYASYRGQTLLTEHEALRLEAALIWALRPQLTNEIQGHGFSLEEHSALRVLDNVQTVELDDDIRALMVWTKGLRGGRSVAGDFIVPADEDAWENSRRWWQHGKAIRDGLDRHVAQGVPVVLMSFASGKRGIENIVIGVWQLSGWHFDAYGDVKKVVFERVEASAEDRAVTAIREKYMGKQVMIDGQTLIHPNRRGYAPEGYRKLPRKSDALLR